MPQLTITIDDQALFDRIVNGMAARFSYSGDQSDAAAKQSFVEDTVAAWIEDEVRSYEIHQDRKAAVDEASERVKREIVVPRKRPQ